MVVVVDVVVSVAGALVIMFAVAAAIVPAISLKITEATRAPRDNV